MIVDIVIIAIIGGCILLGYIRGFAKVAIKIIGFITSLVIALILYTPISNYIINNTEIATNLQKTIQGKIYVEEQGGEIENPEDITGLMEKYIDDYTDQIKESSSEYISYTIAISCIRIGTWIALFLIARIVMIFLKIFAGVIEKIPVIKQFNKVRRNYIWDIRGGCGSLWYSCCNKFYITYDEK